MRAFPIDLFAVWADVELVEILSGQWLEAVEHCLLGDGFQRMVAAQAAVERRDPLEEVEALDHLGQLRERVEGARAVSIHNGFSHEQTAVAGEQDTFLSLQDLRQFLILVIIAIEAVKPQHPQISSQPSEVIV